MMHKKKEKKKQVAMVLAATYISDRVEAERLA